MRIGRIVIIICFLLISGCSDTPKYKKVRLKPQETKETLKGVYKNNTIRLAIASVISPKASLILYADLIEYLRKKSGLNIQLVHGTYGKVNEYLRNSECDIAFICTGAYVRAKADFPLEILAIPVVAGNKSVYYSYIIVSKDSNIKNFDSLKNRSFSFCDPLSLTGYFYVKHRLSKIKETPDTFFSKFIFTGSHDNSIKSVADIITDAACVDSIVYDILTTQKNTSALKTKIIEKSSPFGIPPVVIRAGVDLSIKRKLQNVFLNMDRDNEGGIILKKIFIEKFTLPADKIYDSAELLLKELEVVK